MHQVFFLSKNFSKIKTSTIIRKLKMNPISGVRRNRDDVTNNNTNNNTNTAPSSQQSNNNNNTNLLPKFLPPALITTEATNLIGKIRMSSVSYRKVIDKIEEVVLYGMMQGLDERTIMMKCRRVMEENPIVEVDL